MMLHVTENVAYTFRVTIGWKFELLLIGLKNDDMDRDNMITTYDTAICDAASEKLGEKNVGGKILGSPEIFWT